ncbi:MAG: ABC transporter permease subunit [Firmicutes bacterium]|nr:ABC transporter permease subunit [Bacillota bacterium]
MAKTMRHLVIVVILIVFWELLARSGWYPPLLFPPLRDILRSLSIHKQEILYRTCYSISLIGKGFSVSIGVAFLLAGLAVFYKPISEGVSTLMGIMHPLPAIAILPIALLWFGSGNRSIIAIIIFSSLWPLIANIYNGFRSVPATQLEVGRNLGLKGMNLMLKVMLPASLPHILTGLRIGWARAWQASVAAEMVFGASGGEGGIGWFLYKKRFMMEIPGVFAGLTIIIIIGILVENIILAYIENNTIKKWKMAG